MKTLAYYLLGIFSLCLLNACSDEENPTPEPPPSKGQEEVQKIVEVLKESNPEVSQFVEILEKVNVADLTQDELTVFAVKNKNTASRAAVLDTASIKNHIVKGRYAKEDLTDGSTLTSISNETLYVTRTENDVQINGVKIEGNAIPAGNSYVYVVPELIHTFVPSDKINEDRRPFGTLNMFRCSSSFSCSKCCFRSIDFISISATCTLPFLSTEIVELSVTCIFSFDK